MMSTLRLSKKIILDRLPFYKYRNHDFLGRILPTIDCHKRTFTIRCKCYFSIFTWRKVDGLVSDNK